MQLEHYGFIGDLHTGALVSAQGSIDWLCLPRFDSDACFAALLGTEENGFWRIAPRGTETCGEQRYRTDTLVLETKFKTEAGTVRLIDCMPPADVAHDVVRVVEGVEGEVPMKLTLAIRFDYGATVPWVRHHDGGVRAIAGPNALVFHSDVETHGEGLTTVAEFTIAAGERRTFVLAWHRSHENGPKPVDAMKAPDQTVIPFRQPNVLGMVY